MDDSLPTGSITGQQGWEWNRLYGDRRSRGASGGAEPPDARPTEGRPRPNPGAVRRPAARQSSDVELEQAEQRLQDVISHYEHLLAEKNQQLTEDPGRRSFADRKTDLLAPIRRLVSRL